MAATKASRRSSSNSSSSSSTSLSHDLTNPANIEHTLIRRILNANLKKKARPLRAAAEKTPWLPSRALGRANTRAVCRSWQRCLSFKATLLLRRPCGGRRRSWKPIQVWASPSAPLAGERRAPPAFWLSCASKDLQNVKIND